MTSWVAFLGRLVSASPALCCAYALGGEPAGEWCTELSTLDEEALRTLEFEAGGTADSLKHLDRTRDYVVGELRIVRQPIFNEGNPEESGVFYRAANRLHVNTRIWALRQALLVRSGERATVDALLEAERTLREKPYLYDVRVIPRRLCGDVLDIDIVTRDVWTLNPSLDFGRTGGESSFGIGLSDPNAFGTGRGAGIRYNNDEDRSGVGVYYEDPNLAGTRVRLDLLVENNDDGSRHFMELEQPFFSLDSKFAAGIRIDDSKLEQGLFFLSDEFAEFRHESLFVDLFGGISAGLVGGRTLRWLAGYSYEDHAFEPIPGETAPDPFPEDRTYAYPWIGFEVVENDYEKTMNVDKINRTEDLFLGARYSVRVGFSDDAFGGDDESRWVLTGSYRNGTRLGDRHLLLYGVDGRVFWNLDEDEEEDGLLEAYLSYRMTQTPRISFFASLTGAYARNLPEDAQLLAGGEEGLRGYPNRYQVGDRRLVLQLEERYFSDLYLWRVFRVGAAVFVDVGRAWFPGTSNEEPLGTLFDIGVGLRFESTRTRTDRVLHVDLAFPLQDGPDIEGQEITLTVKRSL